ncbi:MAG: polysaccharide pyruvyl transferase family protein [Paludibacteraceae bacterium]|nr:polysaccharide pyruvyl transferase family protein [Paludibacteraceae bacterium]
MKIGILTFHIACNYGAVLQCYALQEYFKSLGHEAYVIDYRNKFMVDVYRPIRHTLKYSILRFCLRTYKERKLRRNLFNDFIEEHLNLLPLQDGCIPSELDLYVHGSDQIWNPKLLGGYDFIYFGVYNVKEGAKRISYAASFSNKNLNQHDSSSFSEGLRHLDGISLREKSLVDVIYSLTEKSISCVVDPTILAGRSVFDKFVSNLDPIQEKYVLVYLIGPGAKALQAAKRISEEKNLKIKIIGYSGGGEIVSVPEFIYYFKYASYVVCTSFHATVFSILFKKNFYSFISGTDGDERLFSLLEPLGLKDRAISELPSSIENLDYDGIDARLEDVVKQSTPFLSKFL